MMAMCIKQRLPDGILKNSVGAGDSLVAGFLQAGLKRKIMSMRSGKVLQQEVPVHFRKDWQLTEKLMIL